MKTLISTGFPDIDALLGDFFQADLIALMSRVSMGKSTLLLNLIDRVLLQGKKVLLISPETSDKFSVYRKIVAIRAGMKMSELENGLKNTASVLTLRSTVLGMVETPLFVDVDSFNLERIGKQISCGFDLVAIDYFQLLGGDLGFPSRSEELRYIASNLKAIASEFRVPFVVTLQVSQDVEDRPNKRPTVTDAYDCEWLPAIADVAIALYREKYYNSCVSPDIAEVIVQQNAFGSTGTAKLLFEPEYCKFSSL